MMKSTTFSRSAASASGVTQISTWFDASTGTFVSWLTGTASSFTPRRLAYSCARSQAGPLHCSPEPDVFSTSHGALASTPTRSTPAFLIASTRGLVPGAGTATSATLDAATMNSAIVKTERTTEFILTSSFGCGVGATRPYSDWLPLRAAEYFGARPQSIGFCGGRYC